MVVKLLKVVAEVAYAEPFEETDKDEAVQFAEDVKRTARNSAGAFGTKGLRRVGGYSLISE